MFTGQFFIDMASEGDIRHTILGNRTQMMTLEGFKTANHRPVKVLVWLVALIILAGVHWESLKLRDSRLPSMCYIYHDAVIYLKPWFYVEQSPQREADETSFCTSKH